ncbi:hypothetical protein M8542_26705 [Amycolatopsis sp. OK19-0408]|uniref:Uncharacterized protein n=1 Tax=Amycolatopsis iheyensis TaxID=2945988 RepID=A0A9X2NFN4_9PSEU|nr:hypothetical protein [Amycolatopsis iheyensis]MCR6486423.1 hypothetical protein [Amycolatopsis iheyensis]
MLRSRKAPGFEPISSRMKKYHPRPGSKFRSDPEAAALHYCELFWETRQADLQAIDDLTRSRFHVNLSTDNSCHDLAETTKRAALISDTLTLSHDWSQDLHEVGIERRKCTHPEPIVEIDSGRAGDARASLHATRYREENHNETEAYGVHCPNLSELGHWVLDARPLLRAGLAWYVPSFSRFGYRTERGVKLRPRPCDEPRRLHALDLLARDGRLIDGSGATPLKSRLIRPVLQTDLPFIEGTSLRDFSRITVGEFDSYAAFRDQLRLTLLELDSSLDAVQSQQELVKVGLKINDQIRSMKAEIGKVRRKRAAGATGAVLGSVSAILVAAYGPALQTAIAAVGASGGLWGAVHALSENGKNQFRDNKWYYAWVLERSSGRH